ncbi:MAG: hypothetical protein WDA16_07795 [Candidatus Thermoplasmatota archaeon]
MSDPASLNDDLATLLSLTIADLDAAEFLARNSFLSESPEVQGAALHALARLLLAMQDRFEMVQQHHGSFVPHL